VILDGRLVVFYTRVTQLAWVEGPFGFKLLVFALIRLSCQIVKCSGVEQELVQLEEHLATNLAFVLTAKVPRLLGMLIWCWWLC
jgi:hypothetical protein